MSLIYACIFSSFLSFSSPLSSAFIFSFHSVMLSACSHLPPVIYPFPTYMCVLHNWEWTFQSLFNNKLQEFFYFFFFCLVTTLTFQASLSNLQVWPEYISQLSQTSSLNGSKHTGKKARHAHSQETQGHVIWGKTDKSNIVQPREKKAWGPLIHV